MRGMRLLGYTRISTKSQDPQLQLDALTAAGVEPRDVFSDVTSGSKNGIERPGMQRLIDHATSGDTLVGWRVDRLGRSLGPYPRIVDTEFGYAANGSVAAWRASKATGDW